MTYFPRDRELTAAELAEQEHVEEAIRMWRAADYRKQERRRKVWEKCTYWAVAVMGCALICWLILR